LEFATINSHSKPGRPAKISLDLVFPARMLWSYMMSIAYKHAKPTKNIRNPKSIGENWNTVTLCSSW